MYILASIPEYFFKLFSFRVITSKYFLLTHFFELCLLNANTKKCKNLPTTTNVERLPNLCTILSKHASFPEK